LSAAWRKAAANIVISTNRSQQFFFKSPMDALALNARLTPLFDFLKQTQQLITRLSKLSVQPGSTPSNPEEGDARVELSAEIHQSLKEQEEDFELLRQEVEDYTNSSSWSASARRRDSGREIERNELAAQVTRLGEDLKTYSELLLLQGMRLIPDACSARAQFRKAQLQAKRNAEAAKRKERELLFAGTEGGKSTNYGRRKGQEKLSQEDLLVNASSDVTAALRRTHNLMTAELERSRFAQETLENSTKDLATLSESYNNLDTLLSSSRSLVSSLIHSQKSDTWYLESAFYILAITIAWLVFRRLIYGPGWWLLYLPTKLIWQLSLFIVQILVGTLSSAAGIVGAKNQSLALSQSSAIISTSLAQIPTGTGKIPKRQPGQPAPSIMVGAGGQGAKMQPPAQQPESSQESKGDKILSDQIGKMVERSEQEKKASGEGDREQQGTVLKERTEEDGPPNPKKRMFEEPIDQDQESRNRDEL